MPIMTTATVTYCFFVSLSLRKIRDKIRETML